MRLTVSHLAFLTVLCGARMPHMAKETGKNGETQVVRGTIVPPRQLAAQGTARGGEAKQRMLEWFGMMSARGWATLNVRHMNAGKEAAYSIGAVNIPQDKDAWDAQFTREQVAERICEMATHHAKGVGGTNQQYVVMPYDTDGEPMPGQCVFSIPVASMNLALSMQGALDSEPPTPVGHVSQMMRHHETMFKASFTAMAGNLAVYQDEVEQLRNENRELRAQAYENIRIREKLLSRKTEREIEMKLADKRVEMQTELMDTVKMLAPVVVNKLAGKRVLPEKMGSRDLMIKSLVESILGNDLQREKLFNIMKPTQLGQLMALMQTFEEVEKEVEKDKAAEAAKPKKPDAPPDDDGEEE